MGDVTFSHNGPYGASCVFLSGATAETIASVPSKILLNDISTSKYSSWVTMHRGRSLLSMIAWLPRDALLCKARYCYRMSSVCLSVCMSVCLSVCPSVYDVGGSWPHWLKILEINCTNNYPNIFTLRGPEVIHLLPGENGEILGRLEVGWEKWRAGARERQYLWNALR